MMTHPSVQSLWGTGKRGVGLNHSPSVMVSAASELSYSVCAFVVLPFLLISLNIIRYTNYLSQ
jgi:hypothetical protein